MIIGCNVGDCWQSAFSLKIRIVSPLVGLRFACSNFAKKKKDCSQSSDVEPLALSPSSSWKKILVGIMNHLGKNDRNHEYQDSNDSASAPETE